MKAEDMPELVATEHKKLGSHPSTDVVVRFMVHGIMVTHHIKDIQVNYDTKQIEIVAKQ